MSKLTKRKLFTGFAIAVSLAPSLSSVNPIVAEASSALEPDTAYINNEDTYPETYEQLISLVDENIEIVNNKIVVNNKDEIRNYISNNVLNLQSKEGEYKTAQNIYTDILISIDDINTAAQSDSFTLQDDGSIINTTTVVNLNSGEYVTTSALGGGGGGARTGQNEVSSHWWGYRITTYGVNGTRDLKTLFQNNALVQGALITALGLSPAALFAAIPVVTGAYSAMVANSLQNAIDKGDARRGIKLDMTRALPTYRISPR